MVKFSGGLVKIPFTELSKELQEKYHYDPERAAAYAAQEANARKVDVQQAEVFNKQQKQQQQQQAEQAAKQQNIQALTSTYQALLQQEENLLLQIGHAESAQRKYYATPSSLEERLPLLRSQLEDVQEEKRRVKDELDRAQREQQQPRQVGAE